MRYRNLVESLPTKTIVFAFGQFCPPTVGHVLEVQVVKRLAEQNHADHIIFASATQNTRNPLSIERKLHYLKLAFPHTNFTSDQEMPIEQIVESLRTRYKHLILAGPDDTIFEGRTFFVGDDPDIASNKLRKYASKNNFEEFKRGLPPTLREIDARRLMNDIREGMHLGIVKDPIKIKVDQLREKYFRGEIFKMGDIVESCGEKFEIVKRGTNNILVKDQTGKIQNKWIHEVREVQ